MYDIEFYNWEIVWEKTPQELETELKKHQDVLALLKANQVTVFKLRQKSFYPQLDYFYMYVVRRENTFKEINDFSTGKNYQPIRWQFVTKN